MAEALQPGDYGVGGVAYVDQDGFDVPYAYGAIAYLHPPCMLCNVEVMREWPLPVKHGAPMFEAMRALHRAGRSELLRRSDWVLNDVTIGTKKLYVNHYGKGTSQANGTYALDEWLTDVMARRAARTKVSASGVGLNPELLQLIPLTAQKVVEVGCSTGVLARAVKERNPQVHYRGIEIDPIAAEIAEGHCDHASAGDIEAYSDAEWAALADRDCWVFGDVLEHLRDPWAVLRRIRQVLPAHGSVVVCVPNVQHWSVQAKLASGDFRYTDGGLHDRTHLRWFTRTTLLEMFEQAGFAVQAGVARTFHEPQREAVLPAIRAMAAAMGQNAEQAVADALPLQYVIRAVPRVAALTLPVQALAA
jgi:2-polyprenyl-3-methyl-5-hydroxy-6-metoxy-1,4-benzoquinol methylase